MNAKKILALLLALVMVFALVACGNKPGTESPAPSQNNSPAPSQSQPAPSQGTEPEPSKEPELVVTPFPEGTYTYQDAVTQLSTNWNPHTYQTTDESYPMDFLSSGLYTFIFNDELNPVEGTEPYAGYVIVPEMAAEMPIDVTEAIKASHPEFNIPESVNSGYAYEIKLNPNACWDDGTPITADDYVASLERLLRAELMNYRASDYYDGDLCIAGAEAYNKSGQTVSEDNGVSGAYTVADLVKGDDGVYGTAEGFPIYFPLTTALDWCSGYSITDLTGMGYLDPTSLEGLQALADANGNVLITDESMALVTTLIDTPAWGNEPPENLPLYMMYEKTYPTVDFSNVGILKNDDYSITLVLAKSLAGFYLNYNLSGNWLVKTDLYDACLKEENGVWSSTYNTSVETCASYGPYVMTQYQADKFMKFERNTNWWGYTDNKHVYVDPVDGNVYQMYQTDVIETEVVGEAATRKLMFLKGELMGYGLQASDFAQYRSSDYIYFTPSETIFFLILNGHEESINNREAAADFDTATKDLQTMLLKSFRSAIAVTYDKELFAATISPARSGGYGIIGSAYIYDPETGARYRDTDQAKQVLCDYYQVDVSKFSSLDDAVASITGYDPVAATELYKQAFTDALNAGYITDANNDGISDQTVTIEYALSADSDFMTQTINYLNEKMAEVTKGTGFEGKIEFIKSAPYGNDWSNKIREGLSDTVLGGWSGSALNPFSLTDLYVNPARAYDAAWFDGTKVEVTMNINGEDITMTMYNWSDALNGKTVTDFAGVERNYGDGQADVETRLDILAHLEGVILSTGNYLPMLQDASAALLSQQVFYVVEEYNPVMGRGGIAYMKYNYNDADWVKYVADCGGELTY